MPSVTLNYPQLPIVTHSYPQLPTVTNSYPQLPTVTHSLPRITDRFKVFLLHANWSPPDADDMVPADKIDYEVYDYEDSTDFKMW